MPGALLGVSAGMSVAGGVLKGVAAKNAGDANAAIDNANANIAAQAAGAALENGQQQASMAAMRGERTIGAQKAGFAASGVSTGTGSALDVLSDTAMVSKQDQDVIQNNAARTAWGYNSQATNFRNKAALDEQEGTSQEFGDILGGITGAASSVAQMKAG